MKVVDVFQVCEQSVLAGTQSVCRQRSHFVVVQLLLVTLATAHHVAMTSSTTNNARLETVETATLRDLKHCGSACLRQDRRGLVVGETGEQVGL